MSMSGADGVNRPARTQQLAEFVGLAKDSVQLVRQEAQLARQETVEKLAPAARSTVMVLAGAVMGVWGLAFCLQAVVRALSTRMPAWLASLLSGGVLISGGVVLVLRGRRQLASLNIIPQRTINSLKENKEWVLRQIKSRLR